jgi:hypothetical protein
MVNNSVLTTMLTTAGTEVKTSSAFSQQSTLINNNALVFNRGATSVDNDDFDKKFSLAKTLTNIRNTSNATAVLIETTRAVLNSRMRAKFVLSDIGFMILNPER